MIALYFGSFNPVHNGHLMLAQWVVNMGYADEVWFVVSPQNPFKEQAGLMPAEQRLRYLEMATEGNDSLKPCDAELKLPVPSYTINTLRYLKKEYEAEKFAILMGADNIMGLDRWREVDALLDEADIFVYPREEGGELIDVERYAGPLRQRYGARIEYLEKAPRVDISATQIREWLSEGKKVTGYVNVKIEADLEK